MRWRQPSWWVKSAVLVTGWLALASMPTSHCMAVAAANAPAPPPPPEYRLFDAPQKALVVEYCQTCHSLNWIERSGGDLAGWTSRLKRMIRAGATIPRDRIPEVAAYLARALPERPRPEPAPPVTTTPIEDH